MKAIDAVRECWDGEKLNWKPGWRIKDPCGADVYPDQIAVREIFDDREWEVIRPPLAEDEIEVPVSGRLKIVVSGKGVRVGSSFTYATREDLVRLADRHPDPLGWPRALAYFDKHAPPPKVTLREAMKALLRGEAEEAKTRSEFLRVDSVFVTHGVNDHWDGNPRMERRYLRILAGIDPDDGPAEWELVK